MSHFPKPFFRKSRGLWYVQIDGKQINLGPDREAAFQRYGQLLSKPKAPPKTESDLHPLAHVIDDFLDWVKKNRSKDTYEWYRYRLDRFDKKYPDMMAEDVTPDHVQEWVDGYLLSRTSRRNYLRTVKRCLSWAKRRGTISRWQLDALEIPSADHREITVTQAEFDTLLARFSDEEFRDLLTVTFETGCRPQESLRVEARHVDLVNQRWVFPKSESKNKRTSRVVYMTDKAMAIVRKLVERHPTGKLFRNMDGQPWTPSAANCRFQRAKKTLKKRYSLYALRHAWATNALLRGVDPLTVAILLGHRDPSILSRVYQHLSLSPDHMLSQAKKAVG